MWDGEYTGDVAIDLTEAAFATWTDHCSMPLSVVLDSTGKPVVEGDGTCTFAGDLSGKTVDVALEATGWSATEVTGTATTVFDTWTVAHTWSGTFTGSDGMKVNFWGSDKAGSASVSFTGTGTVER